MAARTGPAETGDRAVDGARVGLRDGFVAKAEPIQDSRPEILEHDVRPFQQFPEDTAAFFALQVEADALLISINRKEIGADSANERRPPLPAVVAVGRRLDFD